MKSRKRKPKPPAATDSVPDNELNAVIDGLMKRSPEQWNHDGDLERVTSDHLHECLRSIRAWRDVAKWRLKQGELSGPAGHYVHEVMEELAFAVVDLAEAGDVMLARHIPALMQTYKRAHSVYGTTVGGRATKHLPIEKLLARHEAKDLWEMLCSLHGDMDFVEELRKSFGSGQPTEQQLREALVSEKHWFYETGANTTQELVQRLSVRFGDQAPSGDQLDGIITSRKAWIPTREYSYAQLKEAGRTEEVLEKVRVWQNRSKSAIEVFTMEVWSRRRHRAAEMIEQICAIRESEAHRVNLFVEHLYHGWLWGGPGPTFQKCPWHGKDGLPKRSGLGEWMAIVMPFLKKITGEDASKLSVFRHLLGARRYVYAGGEATGGRLAGDDPTYIWNQVENRIRKAWVPMANQAVKRSAKKAA